LEETPVDLGAAQDLITQAELRKGAELMAGKSSAARLVCAIYMNALARRVADGAAIQPGPLAFDPPLRSVYRKPPGSEVLRSVDLKQRRERS
jgi:hypothetical protein